MEFLLVILGGALGSIARFLCSGLAARRFGERFPTGTLLVNVAGSFAIGLLDAILRDAGGGPGAHEAGRQLFMVGVCGGFTTFSSLSLQTLALWQNRARGWAALNVLATLILGLGAVGLGHVAGEICRGRIG